LLAGVYYAFGFVVVEIDARDVFVKLFGICAREIGCGFVFGKEVGGYQIYEFVSCLSGEDGGNEKLEWVGVKKGCARVGVER